MADELRKEVIVSIQTDASQAGQGVDEVKKKLELLNNVVSDKSIKSLKGELKLAQEQTQKFFKALSEANQEAEEIGRTFGKNSQQFQEAAQKVQVLKSAFDASATAVAGLKNDMDEVNLSIKNFNPDNKFEALGSLARAGAGALQGVAGAMAFLGVESESAQQTIAKLQGLMAFSDALNSLGDLKDSWKNINTVISSSTILKKADAAATSLASGAMRLLGVSATATGTAFQALKAAIAATGIGLLIVGIGTLLPLISDWISGTKDAEEANQRLESSLSSLNSELDFNQKMIAYQTEVSLKYAKIAGKSQEEQFKISREGRKRELDDIERDVEEKRKLYNKSLGDLDLDAEARKKISDEFFKAEEKKKDKEREVYLSDLDEKARLADEERKKQKEANDKAYQLRKQNADNAKAVREKELAELKSYQDAINALNREALKALAEHGLNQRDLELKQNDDAYKERLKAFEQARDAELKLLGKNEVERNDIKKKYAEIGGNLLAQNLQSEQDIRDKFNKQVTDFLLEQTQTEFEQRKLSIEREFDELIKVAGDKSSELEALKQSKLGQVDKEEKLRIDTVKSETNLITTQTENVITDSDTPDQRREKIEAIRTAELDAENAAFELKREQLRGQKQELEKLEAEHNAKINDINRDASETRKAIDAAELEAKRQIVDTGIGIANKAADLLGKNTVAGKALAVAATTVETYKSAQSAYTGMVSAIPGPVGIAAGVAAAAVSVAAGLANVKKILSVKVPAKSGDSSGGSTAAPAISTAPVIQATQTAASTASIQDVRVVNEKDRIMRAYITDRDLKDNEEKSSFLNNLSSF